MAGRTGGRPYRRNRAALRGTSAVCWLCGKPIDRSLPSTDPMSWTADHATPYAHGGSDRIDNLRPAHKRCNSARGTKSTREARSNEPSRDWTAPA